MESTLTNSNQETNTTSIFVALLYVEFCADVHGGVRCMKMFTKHLFFEVMHRLDRVIFFMCMITALNIIPWMMLKVMIMGMKMLTLSRMVVVS